MEWVILQDWRTAICGYLTTIQTFSFFTTYDVTSWHINRTPYHLACAIMNIIQQLNILHDVAWFFTGYKISELVVHWHSDSCTSCSYHISNHSTVLAQECNWQRWWLQVLWFLQHVQKGCLKIKVVCWNVFKMWLFLRMDILVVILSCLQCNFICQSVQWQTLR